jgi:hypothetical protein
MTRVAGCGRGVIASSRAQRKDRTLNLPDRNNVAQAHGFVRLGATCGMANLVHNMHFGGSEIERRAL